MLVNGAKFQSAFHWHVLDRGVQHVDIKPATPRLNGKVERSHRIDADEFYRLLDGVVLDDARLFTIRNGRTSPISTARMEAWVAKLPTIELSSCGCLPGAAAAVLGSPRIGSPHRGNPSESGPTLRLLNRPMLVAEGRAKGKNIPLNPGVTTSC